MSTLVSYLIDDAAAEVGDPNKTRIALPQWLSIYNRANRELCTKANILPFSDSFDLRPLDPDTGRPQQRYAYPEQMTVLKSIEVSETPDDDNSFRYLNEMFEDEFRERTASSYPTNTLPDSYFADAAWFFLVPIVTATIEEGGWITYYGLPDRIDNVAGAIMQVDDFAQDYLLRRMIIVGLSARNRHAEAATQLAIWDKDMEGLQDKLNDRSQDRRPSLAPRRSPYRGMR